MKARPARRTSKKAGARKNAEKRAGAKRPGSKPAQARAELAPAKPRTVTAIADIALPPAAAQADAPASVAAPAVDAAAQASRRAGLRLEPSCTLRDALDMQFQLLATDFGDSDVLLDGSAVERIDTAGLQMLVAFAKQHAASGRRIQWTAASQELQRGSRLLGLDETLGLNPPPPEVSGGH
mgnify:CR=1 FL=1